MFHSRESNLEPSKYKTQDSTAKPTRAVRNNVIFSGEQRIWLHKSTEFNCYPLRLAPWERIQLTVQGTSSTLVLSERNKFSETETKLIKT